MRERHASQAARRAREFEAFVAGAAGRLLQPPRCSRRSRRTPTRARGACCAVSLAHTYALLGPAARRRPLRPAPGPSSPCASQRAAWHRYGGLGRLRPAPAPDSVLARLTPQERLILVLRLYEGVAEEQTAALLGLPAERVRAVCARATATLLHPPRGPAPARMEVAPS